MRKVNSATKKCVSLIDASDRFRVCNLTCLENDPRIPRAFGEAVVALVDSFPTEIQKPRNSGSHYWCAYHKKICVKHQIILSHESIAIHVSSEYAGSVHDSTIFQHTTCFPHFERDMILGDTAYSALPHIVCPHEHPVTNRERAFNAVCQIVRQRVERYFAMLNTFRLFWYCNHYARGPQSFLTAALNLVCAVSNFKIMLGKSATKRLPTAQFCACLFIKLGPEEKRRRAVQLQKERLRRKRRRDLEISQGFADEYPPKTKYAA